MERNTTLEDLRFIQMVNQTYTSIDFCQTFKDFQNVYDGWIKRILREFRLNEYRQLMILTLFGEWKYRLQQLIRIKSGTGIIKTAFKEN